MELSSLHVREIAPGTQEITSEQGKIGSWEFHIDDESSYYGMGERFDDLNHAHTVMKNISRDTGFAKGTSSYQPIPFFMSTAGYGLWVDTYSAATFDFNISSPDISVTLVGDRLRLVVFEGPRFSTILDRFTSLVGRTKLPPYWAFAPWKARDYHLSDADVEEDIRKTRQLGLPADVLLIDSPWATNYNTFEFNTKQFEDPRAMIDRLHQAGFKLCLWLTPFVNVQNKRPGEPGMAAKIPLTAAANFAEGDTRHYFVRNADGTTYISSWWKGNGALVDFTNPEATSWWQSQVGKAVKMGADAFKDDDGEGNFVGGARFFNGADSRMMRMRYTVLYNQAMEQVIQKQLAGDGVLFIRSASVGSQNLPMFWSGDNAADFSDENGLPSVVRAGLSAGMSGISLWVSDLGGYIKKTRTPEDATLFQRWTEYSAFSPGMEVMSALNLGPWDYGEEALNTYRKFAVLHMSLFPYRYQAAQESARDGMPMMRALVLEHQDDDAARTAEDEYEFGPDLLVAPVITPGTQRTVYIPDGEWLDLWNGRPVPSRHHMIVDVPLDSIPVYVRAGSILAKIPEDVMTLVPPASSGNREIHSLDDRRVYEIYAGPSRTETDFEGRTLTTMRTGGEGSLSIDGKPAEVTLRFPFQKVSGFTVDGKSIQSENQNSSTTITFRHQEHSEVRWKQ
ncbi:MAG TPA: TIM-barrel domain-containing protein [Acidobacteriaceae bacterium]|nr:TIM-barrel domain-containing protein [Acidobacteriaceae bacterium]